MSTYGYGTCTVCGTVCTRVWDIDAKVRCAVCAIRYLSLYGDRPEAVQPEAFETEAEREEREASAYAVPDSDMQWYLEAAYVDPTERNDACCYSSACGCGGYFDPAKPIAAHGRLYFAPTP